MTAIRPTWQAQHRKWIAQLGTLVTIKRITGIAPNTVTTPAAGATITAIVRNYLPDGLASSETGYAGGKIGGISEGNRQIIFMADELLAKGFPLPLQKNDRVILQGTGEVLSISRVDIFKRAVAGCVEAYAAGAL